MTAEINTENLAETLARELKQPEILFDRADFSYAEIALPEGWTLERQDREHLLPQPRFKSAKPHLHDTESFVAYVQRHANTEYTTLYVDADGAKIKFTAILDDHGGHGADQQWRRHTATHEPKLSVEWQRWNAQNGKAMTQTAFAAFIEDNLQDIPSADGLPTGAQMLEMALNMEATQDSRFKSAIRLQSGGVQLNYVAKEDDATLAKMELFDRFAIGIPVFFNGIGYQLSARLRYRIKEGALTFWYEIVRPDKTFNAAAKEIIEIVRDSTELMVLLGEPRL